MPILPVRFQVPVWPLCFWVPAWLLGFLVPLGLQCTRIFLLERRFQDLTWPPVKQKPSSEVVGLIWSPGEEV